jgi:hypothetical protein
MRLARLLPERYRRHRVALQGAKLVEGKRVVACVGAERAAKGRDLSRPFAACAAPTVPRSVRPPRPISVKLLAPCDEALLFNRFAHLFGKLQVVMQVVNGVEHCAQNFAGFV